MMRTEKLAVSALEQPSARSARPALGGPAVLALQRSAGNQAVTRMLAGTKRVLARTETTFNPWSAVHDLRRAVDQSQASDGWGFDDSGTLRASTRKVDAARVIRVLEALTPPQIALVRSLYQAQERTTLENDLFGSGQSEHASNLKPDQRARIEALLKGGSDTRLEATAIELHQLLSGELEEAERERVMALLRRPADEIEAIDGHYLRLYHRHPNYDLALKLKGPQLERATALRAGDVAQADAHAIEDNRRALAELQAKRDAGDLSIPEALSYEHKRRQLIDGITTAVQANRRDAIADPANAGKPADQAATARLAGVMATRVGPAGAKLEDELAFTLKGTEAAGIVVADRSLVETAARRLLELEARHTTDAVKVAELLRGLRGQAEHDAIAAIPTLPPAKQQALAADPPTLTKEQLVAERAARYLEMFVATYNFLRLPHGRPWGAIVASASPTNREMLDALTSGAGELDAVDELRFAIKRRDAAAIERLLRGHPAPPQLEREYDGKFAPETLHDALFGFGGAEMAAGPHGPLPILTGAVTGRDAALADELLDSQPKERGGAEEVDWIVSRAEREIEATEANSGAIGGLRELGDRPDTQGLMHESLAQLRMLQQQWREHPEHHDEILAEMRQVRATVTGDASAYQDDNDQLRAQVRSAVSFAVQVALAIALPGVGRGISGFFATTALNIGTTVAGNLAIYGDQYSLQMLYDDVIGSGLGALGGKLGEEATNLVARQVTKDAAETAVRIAGEAGRTPKLAQELEQAAAGAQEARQRLKALAVAGAGEVGNMAGSAAATNLATGGGISADGQLQVWVLNRLRHRHASGEPAAPTIEESPPGGFPPTTAEPPAEEPGPEPEQVEIDPEQSDGVPEPIHDEPATEKIEPAQSDGVPEPIHDEPPTEKIEPAHPRPETRVLKDPNRTFPASVEELRQRARERLSAARERMLEHRRTRGASNRWDGVIAELQTTDPAFAALAEEYYRAAENPDFIEEKLAVLYEQARQHQRTMAAELEHILGGETPDINEFRNSPDLSPEQDFEEFRAQIRDPRTLVDLTFSNDVHGSHTHAFQEYLGDCLWGPGEGRRFRQRLAELTGTGERIQLGGESVERPFWSRAWEAIFDDDWPDMHSPEVLGRMLQEIADFPRWISRPER